MNNNVNTTGKNEEIQNANFDEIERILTSDLEENIKEIEYLKDKQDIIRNPDRLGEAVKTVIIEQIQNQFGFSYGEKFVQENNGLYLDLKDSAHIQTTDNFKNGKIATHNTYIDYQERYDQWQDNFQKAEDGNVIYKFDRIDNENKPQLVKGYRKPYDNGREKGNASYHMDETVSVAEQVRDPAANAHLSLKERVEFDQSDINLHPMDSSANESKGDHKAENWLKSERNGQTPGERFNIDEEEIRENDRIAREEYEKLKAEGEKKSLQTGKQSQKEEAFRLGKNVVKAAIMRLLFDFTKEIVSHLVCWFKSCNKQFKTLLETLKNAIHSFVIRLKKEIINIGDTVVTTIATTIFGPIIRLFNKIWILLKQGWNSLIQAVEYMRNPKNKNQPFEVMILEVRKIFLASVTAGGALVLSEVIEKGLLSISVFAIEIPLLGSLANVCGIFFGAIVSGIIGALLMNLIDSIIEEKIQKQIVVQLAEKENVKIKTQTVLTWNKLGQTYNAVTNLTQTSISELQECERREKASLSRIDDKLDKLRFIMNKRK